MALGKEATIHAVCEHLKQLAQNEDDIFFTSFTADGKAVAYQVYNKGDGKEGIAIDFPVETVHFTDTAGKEKTTLMDYMKAKLYNPKNGDGELVIAYDGRSQTMHMMGAHHTNLGESVGGLREKDYSTFDSMATDTLRLARGMTYKAAMCHSQTGGGKATRTVPKGIRKEANLGTGRIVNFMNFLRAKRGVPPYVTAEDSATHCSDMDQIDEVCPEVICKSLPCGGAGNPSPVTAIGVFHACKAGAEFAFPDKSLKGKTVLLSGVGQVGFELAKNLVYNGCEKVICAEMSKERSDWVKDMFRRMHRTEKIEFMVYTKEELSSQKFLHDLANEVDIFAPCALGKSINDTNINAIKGTRLKLICGGENNQLADEEKHGKALHEMGIVYVPDYVANAGGLINSALELQGRMFLTGQSIEVTKKIEATVREVLALAKEKNIPSYLAANQIAEERFLGKK